MIDLTRTPAAYFSRRMVRIKFIQHIQDDLRKMPSIGKLPTKISYLNHAYILHLVAHWQVFNEELASYGFSLLEQKDKNSPFVGIAKAKLDQCLKRFNTPSKKNIDKLFEEALGIDGITRCWSEKIEPSNLGAETLDRVLQARHRIAHTGSAHIKLSYETNYEDMKVLVRLAQVMEDRLRELL